MFPNILDFLSTDPSTPWMHYAIVLNGKLQATNNKMACYIDVSTFIEDEAQIKAIEGKVFNSEDLITMRDQKIKFTENGFINMIDPKEYTGTIGQNREIRLYDDIMDEYVLAKDFKKFPDLTQVLPAITEKDVNISHVQKRNTHFRGVGLSPGMLMSISKSFQQYQDDKADFIRLEFFHADKSKDKVNQVTAPILVSPRKSKFPLYHEVAIINPAI